MIRVILPTHLRNLAHVDATFGERFNVIAGDNGQGKTNLLEAIYVLATSKSFRPKKQPKCSAFRFPR